MTHILNPWKLIPKEWLSELSIAVSHRLDEAPLNAYVHTDEARAIEDSLRFWFPELYEL